ncbi:MAG: phytanoyl-CoA dioxygenase family protein [Saprospiraceae bacterium]
MSRLRDIFKRYTGFLRDLKVVYVINNYLNSDKLQHNKALYKKYGVNKSIFSSIGRKDMPKSTDGIPWIDQPNAIQKVMKHPDFQTFSPDLQQKIIDFIENGYLILEGFLNEKIVQNLNNSIEDVLRNKEADFNFTGKKVMDAHKVSKEADDHFRNPELLKLLSFLLGKKVLPFQSINFREGSEQRAHSDSIHMTTEPEGYLIATWSALEDCHEGNGSLFYYPKSHRLPFVSCEDYNAGHSVWLLGKESYPNYEDKIDAVIKENQLEKKYFHAKKGDLLIWHANLLHGGSGITQKGTTRKSMVCHYYAEDVVCYHELTQRPALINN